MAVTTFSTDVTPAPGRLIEPKPRTVSDILVEAGIAKDRAQVAAFLIFMSLILFAASVSLLASSVPAPHVEASAALSGAR